MGVECQASAEAALEICSQDGFSIAYFIEESI